MQKLLKTFVGRCVLAGAIFGFIGILAIIQAAESKYDTGTTAAEHDFGPTPSGYWVRGLYAKSDKAASVVKFYLRYLTAVPTATPTNGAEIIYISNASFASSAGFTTNDIVVYSHANGTLDRTTLSAATASNVTLAANITVAGATGDKLYKLTEQFELPLGATSLNPAGSYICAVPGDSPLYIVADGTAVVSCAATTDR